MHSLPAVRLAGVLGVVACSSPARPVARAPAPVPVVADAYVADAAPVAAGEPDAAEACTGFVLGDSALDADDIRTDGEGGRTWDEKRDEVARGPDTGACDLRHRAQLEAELAKVAAAPSRAPVRAWDRKAPLAYAPLVRGALALTPAEEQQLARDGFVVPERLQYDTYSAAFYDIHRGQLPIYVSADAILHAVYLAHDTLLAQLESAKLQHTLDRVLGAMACALPAAAADYPPEIARDLDVYLTVARSLLAGYDQDPADPANADQVQRLVHLITEAGPRTRVELFGRVRTIDPNAFTPRGHYDGDLASYFRAAMWVSRIELNLVSRDTRSSDEEGDRHETPREDVLALALADLVDRAHAGADLAALDRAWTLFAGKREDVGVPELLALRAQARIARLTDPDAAAKLRAAIGSRFARTVNTHPNPNASHLPAIATLLGPRILSSTDALAAVASGRGPDSQAAELGYVLGIDRGAAYTDPAIAPRLARGRAEVGKIRGDDLYTAWLGAVRAYAEMPPGAKPSFMEGPAFADLRLDTAIVAFGQLAHDHVLVGAQLYDQGGCEIPDGYVEPALPLYRALAAYADRGAALYRELDPRDVGRAGAYFARLRAVATTLAGIASDELAGKPLSDAGKHFLAMVVEMREATAHTYTDSYPIATYDGWYIDLFPSLDAAFHTAAFIADYLTFDRDGRRGVKYVGATGPRLGVFAVDTGGGPRMMVGPVAHGFQVTGTLEEPRFTDDSVAGLAAHGRLDSPWTKRYGIAAAAPPKFQLSIAVPRPGQPERRRRRDPDPAEQRPGTIRIVAAADQGAATLQLLDHHFVEVGKITSRIGAGQVDLAIPATARPIESVRVLVGTFAARVDLDLRGYGSGSFGGDGSGAAP